MKALASEPCEPHRNAAVLFMGACTCEACEPYWNTYVGLIHALASELCEPYRNDILSSEAFEECEECE